MPGATGPWLSHFELLLDALEAIAASRFDGCVECNMTTAIYMARLRSSDAATSRPRYEYGRRGGRRGSLESG
jgi:hypothetical protein